MFCTQKFSPKMARTGDTFNLKKRLSCFYILHYNLSLELSEEMTVMLLKSFTAALWLNQ